MFLDCIKHHLNKIIKVDTNYYSKASIHCKKTLFIHIPKTGGVSISKALYGNLGLGHRSILWAIENLGKITDDYFIFTIVRDPIDRFISTINYLDNGGMNQDRREWSSKYLESEDPLNQFVKNHLSYLIKDDIHFRPQTEFLLENKNISRYLNKVYRFEDFSRIKQDLKKRLDISVLHENRTLKKRFSKANLTESSIRSLKHIYIEDYTLLKY